MYSTAGRGFARVGSLCVCYCPFSEPAQGEDDTDVASNGGNYRFADFLEDVPSFQGSLLL